MGATYRYFFPIIGLVYLWSSEVNICYKTIKTSGHSDETKIGKTGLLKPCQFLEKLLIL